REGRALFGWDKSEKIDFERFLAVVCPADREATRQAVRRALDGQSDYDWEYRIVLPDGAERCMTARAKVEFNGDHKPLRMRGVSIDITARKKAEDKFRLAVEASPNGIVLVDPDGRILLANALTEKMFGYGRNELTGQPVENLVPQRFRGNHPG